ncbi:MAG: WavE lipopolysaccharide synthesis family protein [Pontiella sp.]
MKQLSSQHKALISFRERPHKPTITASTYHPNAPYAPTAIVLQGPVLHENNFTLETLKHYSQVYPDCSLILSTWEDTDTRAIENLNLEKLEIVLSPYPEVPGPSHINYQIASSAVGMQRANELGVSYVFKTRTDQRMYAPSSVALCHSMLQQFPINHTIQKNRLIGISLNTYKYRPYPMSDMFMFGDIDDMSRYWNAPYDLEPQKEGGSSMLDFSRQRLCEVYLMTCYLESIGFKLEWTLSNSWKAIGSLFAIVDDSMLDLYWPKYEREFQEAFSVTYENSTTGEEIQFSDWLLLHTQGASIAAPEEVLQLKFREAIHK